MKKTGNFFKSWPILLAMSLPPLSLEHFRQFQGPIAEGDFYQFDVESNSGVKSLKVSDFTSEKNKNSLLYSEFVSRFVRSSLADRIFYRDRMGEYFKIEVIWTFVQLLKDPSLSEEEKAAVKLALSQNFKVGEPETLNTKDEVEKVFDKNKFKVFSGDVWTEEWDPLRNNSKFVNQTYGGAQYYGYHRAGLSAGRELRLDYQINPVVVGIFGERNIRGQGVEEFDFFSKNLFAALGLNNSEDSFTINATNSIQHRNRSSIPTGFERLVDDWVLLASADRLFNTPVDLQVTGEGHHARFGRPVEADQLQSLKDNYIIDTALISNLGATNELRVGYNALVTDQTKEYQEIKDVQHLGRVEYRWRRPKNYWGLSLIGGGQLLRVGQVSGGRNVVDEDTRWKAGPRLEYFQLFEGGKSLKTSLRTSAVNNEEGLLFPEYQILASGGFYILPGLMEFKPELSATHAPIYQGGRENEVSVTAAPVLWVHPFGGLSFYAKPQYIAFVRTGLDQQEYDLSGELGFTSSFFGGKAEVNGHFKGGNRWDRKNYDTYWWEGRVQLTVWLSEL